MIPTKNHYYINPVDSVPVVAPVGNDMSFSRPAVPYYSLEQIILASFDSSIREDDEAARLLGRLTASGPDPVYGDSKLLHKQASYDPRTGFFERADALGADVNSAAAAAAFSASSPAAQSSPATSE